MTDILHVDQDRRRYLLQQVFRKVEGWQRIWMTTDFAHESPVAKGRYLAAKAFYDWLADGGDLSKAKEYLEEQKKHYRAESDKAELFILADQLTRAVAAGHMDDGDLRVRMPNAYLPGFQLDEKEKALANNLRLQHAASCIELWHLERFLT